MLCSNHGEIQCAIDEWATGEHSIVKFQAVKYVDVYQHHVKNLESLQGFNEMTNSNMLGRLQCDLLEAACQHAGDTVNDSITADTTYSLDLADFMMDQGGPIMN
ncbi:hypothetical protein EDC04DRAFT_2908102 [Pisolithus marmoratus]|nr:hypothetical protein EDC04DRAFT_2908102 [Pisolithus marmoratus]